MSETNRADGELLAEFSAGGGDAAFTELVQRHAPMVRAVAARVLDDRHEAQDVAQAAFLALARKAAKFRRDAAVGGWLHRAAWCLARDVRASRLSRQRREEEAMRTTAQVATPDGDREALRAELDRALAQLPERYRQPLVLFHLEERSLDETARLLALNPATLRTRLSRGRERLRQRLVRRGVTVASVAALTPLLAAEAGAAELPATFVSATVQAAGLAAAGNLASGVASGLVSAHVAALTKGTLHMLFMTQLKTAAVIIAAGVVLAGTGAIVAKEILAPAAPAPIAKVDPRAAATAPVAAKPAAPELSATSMTVDQATARFEGAVVFRCDSLTIHAERGRVNTLTQEFWFEGAVRVEGADPAPVSATTVYYHSATATLQVDDQAPRRLPALAGAPPAAMAARAAPRQRVQASIDQGLAWLAKNQIQAGPDAGAWPTGTANYRPAVSSLAGLAFLAAGCRPGEGPYGPVVARTLGYVMPTMAPDGYLGVGDISGMYIHAINLLFGLACLGAAEDREANAALAAWCRRGIQVTLAAQRVPRPAAAQGGWRYTPLSAESDVSVTAWQVHVLHAARQCGFEIGPDVFTDAWRYVDRAYADLPGTDTGRPLGGYLYRAGYTKTPGYGPTGAAVLVKTLSGGGADARTQAAAAYLASVPPSWGGPVYNGLYFCTSLYVAQGLCQVGGETWNRYRTAQENILLAHQADDGSWPYPPDNNYPGEVIECTGPAYPVAMAVLILALDQQLLPASQRPPQPVSR